MQESSLARRYAFKLLANLAAVPVYIVMEALMPRALGPAAYGNFNFITAQFQQVTTFLDMGSSTCLCTALSKRPGEVGLVAFYLRVAMAIFILTLLAGLLCLYPPLGGAVLPGVPLWLAPLGAFWACLIWSGRILRGMNDALGITVPSETVRMSFSILGALTLLGLYLGGWLTLPALFVQQYFFLLLPAVGYALVLRRAWNSGRAVGVETDAPLLLMKNLLHSPSEQTRAYFSEFRRYSGPLFTLALASALALGGERWLLQFSAGSEAQGYFALGEKVGLACFIFVSAMTPLFMRELSRAHGQKDLAGMGLLLDRYAPILYSVAAVLSAFACVEADELTRLFGGAKFAAAVPVVRVMALFPLHQAYMQLTGAVFHASAETKALRNVSLVFLALGVVLSYFLIAAPSREALGFLPGGLGLGALGLAIKSVGVQVVAVSCLLWVCSRRIPFRLGRNLLHQVLSLGVFLLLALGAKEFAALFFSADGGNFARFLLAGVFYGFGCLTLLVLFPWLAGLRREDLLFIATKLNFKKN